MLNLSESDKLLLPVNSLLRLCISLSVFALSCVFPIEIAFSASYF